jgi:hypothetical protein
MNVNLKIQLNKNIKMKLLMELNQKLFICNKLSKILNKYIQMIKFDKKNIFLKYKFHFYSFQVFYYIIVLIIS